MQLTSQCDVSGVMVGNYRHRYLRHCRVLIRERPLSPILTLPCPQASKECTCTVTEQCDTCPPSYPLPPECRVTGRREHVKCSPGDHEFYQQCKRTGGDEARKNSFWVFYLSSGIMLIGSVVAVNHRKQFLDYSNSVRLEEM